MTTSIDTSLRGSTVKSLSLLTLFPLLQQTENPLLEFTLVFDLPFKPAHASDPSFRPTQALDPPFKLVQGFGPRFKLTQEVQPRSKSNQASDPLYDPAEAADYIGVKESTLSVWRCVGRYDIEYIKVGRLVKYRKSALDAFLERRTRSQVG
jgi:excisionase family DNA binding protein